MTMRAPLSPAEGADASHLSAEVARLTAQNEQLTTRFIAEEARASEMMALLVALRQLHEAIDREALLAAIADVIVNVLGSEQLAIMTLDADSRLVVVRAMGVPDAGLATTATPLLSHIEEAMTRVGGRPPLACVPLVCGATINGALAIFGLLEHRGALGPADLDLLDLVSVHAGSALAATANVPESLA